MDIYYLKDLFDLTENECTILDYLDTQVNAGVEISIRKLAKECFTSPSSIVRLAKKLNLSGYNELLFKIKAMHFPSQTSPSISDEEKRKFAKFFKENQDGLVAIIGTGFSFPICSYISEVLNFHFIPNVCTSHTRLIQKTEQQKILFLFVSHSGEEEELVKTITFAKKYHHPTIAFLGDKFSTLGKMADLTFSTNSYSPFSTSHAKPQVFFGQTLISFEELICEYLNQI
ncbi:transcriptional regulator, RpiR family [Pilibacter termitis]|uniref:Transcriptional regulator, RpiR family n=1 Tax=Pilibacter termitis TaxID=263852 RepID=A0A1T4LVF5_9ENTE|nr:SIS domain-containing protein [Pilibacter termitis]SJZ58478.1 transcriptional regulator, RpiR family [Pilibacter termitis]